MINKTIIFLMFWHIIILTILTAEPNPVIKNLIITNITETAVEIRWETEDETDGQVIYGLSISGLSSIGADLNKSLKHSVRIDQLLKGTRYYFRIDANSDDKTFSSEIYNFRTAGTALPLFLTLNMQNVKPLSAEISYVLNTPCSLKLDVISKKDGKKQAFIINDYRDKGIFTLTNLTPDTLYYYSFNIENTSGERSKTEVFNFSTPPLNYALNKKVSGTFNVILKEAFFNTQNPILDRITDGKLDYFSGMAVSGDISKEDQFVIIDLGKECEISKIKIFWRALAYSEDYSVLLSKDNKTWEKTAEHIDASAGLSIRGEKGDPIQVNESNFTPKKTRYVKLLVNKNSKYYVNHSNWNFIQLMEIMVY